MRGVCGWRCGGAVVLLITLAFTAYRGATVSRQQNGRKKTIWIVEG